MNHNDMNSPYIKNENRLSDVLAAIQVMGVYKFYKLTFEEWADRIVGDKAKGGYWRDVFNDHPEFFRLDQSRTKASLVWRRSYPKIFNVDTGTSITKDDYLNLSEQGKMRISRSPLSNNDIQTLISSAINLSNIAQEAKKNKEWWKPALFALLGVIMGSLLNHFFK